LCRPRGPTWRRAAEVRGPAWRQAAEARGPGPLLRSSSSSNNMSSSDDAHGVGGEVEEHRENRLHKVPIRAAIPCLAPPSTGAIRRGVAWRRSRWSSSRRCRPAATAATNRTDAISNQPTAAKCRSGSR
jgi:hypothetical protein